MYRNLETDYSHSQGGPSSSTLSQDKEYLKKDSSDSQVEAQDPGVLVCKEKIMGYDVKMYIYIYI